MKWRGYLFLNTGYVYYILYIDIEHGTRSAFWVATVMLFTQNPNSNICQQITKTKTR